MEVWLIKNKVISSKVHIGNDQYISLDAFYNGNEVNKFSYKVYKMYGYRKKIIIDAEVTKLGIVCSNTIPSHYGVNNNLLKERAFGAFRKEVICPELENYIKTIIKGET